MSTPVPQEKKKTLKREVKNLMGNLSHMARTYNYRTLIKFNFIPILSYPHIKNFLISRC